MTKAVYIGAGTDCIPLLLLETIKEFIYIDSQPQSEFGTMEYESGRFYRHLFLSQLDSSLHAIGFEPVKRQPLYLEYMSKSGQVLNYYINTPFPAMLTKDIKTHLESSDTLILSGFDPHKSILNLMPILKTIYCNDRTVYVHDAYADEAEKEASVFYELVQNSANYSYTYKRIKQLEYHEYWNYKSITRETASLYTVEPCDGLKNVCVDRSTPPHSLSSLS
jgi:hypothetical protein